ncbi:hypothetical protein I0C86_11290 [Plantactinospora sp. S1510]|uniref:DUF4232 domain-containing protein n=1 Tax=Plantactinospora alkalitolerans TaxID=2789879 RepID=A0ABS0GTL8_9ACTN|nr:hypothetical protein [Plantactinospora alkalitolerans]MBF9129545.1 hypothetical protein [Plantactinospora alkalitolerans]
MNLDNGVEQPDLLDTEFTALREQLLSDVHPIGPAAVRHTVRRRRQRTAVVMSVVAVAVIAVPVASFTALSDRGPAPGGTGVPPPSLAPTPSATPTVSPTPTGTPPPPNGRLTREELLGGTFDLPDWPEGTSSTCGGPAVKLRSGPVNEEVPALLDLSHGDVDSDGAVETLARLECRSSADWPKQIVAFDRDATGRIVVLGQVVRTGGGVADLREFAVEDGSVRVRVADQCCGANPAQTQWRTYTWKGDRFRQTAGPTSFPSTKGDAPTTPTPAIPTGRLTLTATDLTYGPVEGQSGQRGTMTVTVVNPTGATVQFPVVTFFDNDKDSGLHAEWSSDCPVGGHRDNRLFCISRPLAPGERRSIVFPFGTSDLGPARTLTVRVDIASDREGTIVPNSGNQTTFQASVAS